MFCLGRVFGGDISVASNLNIDPFLVVTPRVASVLQFRLLIRQPCFAISDAYCALGSSVLMSNVHGSHDVVIVRLKNTNITDALVRIESNVDHDASTASSRPISHTRTSTLRRC